LRILEVDRRNYDSVILYVVGKLLSKVDHIELSALRVYFKGFIAIKTSPELNIISYKVGG